MLPHVISDYPDSNSLATVKVGIHILDGSTWVGFLFCPLVIR